MTDNEFPTSATPDSLDFSIHTIEDSAEDFIPLYYPSRFTITTEKKLERTEIGCDGEAVSIEKLKNSTFHVTGKVHASDLSALNDIAHTTQKVEINTPALPTGSMNAYVKSAERGEIIGYDAYPEAEEWMFKYTIDLVSTGENEYESSSKNRYVEYEGTAVDQEIRDKEGFGL